MHQSPVERVPYDEHPNRCKALAGGSQCINLGLVDGGNCVAYGGVKQQKSEESKSLSNYRLTTWRAKLQRHSTSEGVKSLRDEIGILRMMMEERLNRISDAHDMILQSGPISDLVMKIDKVVTSCHKLEGSMGELLDKQAILHFASQVIGIITESVEDTELVNSIADQIMETIT